MQEISFSYQVENTVPVPIEPVFNYFNDIQNFYHCSVDIQHFELINARASSWVLSNKGDMGLNFQPHYTIEYQPIENYGLRWNSTSGNVDINGVIIFEYVEDSITKIKVTESVCFTLPVSLIMSKIIRPIAANQTRDDMLKLLERARHNINKISNIGLEI